MANRCVQFVPMNECFSTWDEMKWNWIERKVKKTKKLKIYNNNKRRNVYLSIQKSIVKNNKSMNFKYSDKGLWRKCKIESIFQYVHIYIKYVYICIYIRAIYAMQKEYLRNWAYMKERHFSVLVNEVC